MHFTKLSAGKSTYFPYHCSRRNFDYSPLETPHLDTHLLFETSALKENGKKSFAGTSLCLFLALFLLPSLFSAAPNYDKISEPQQSAEIQIVGDVIVYDGSRVENKKQEQISPQVEIAVEKAHIETSSEKVSTIKKIEHQAKAIVKSVEPKFVFIPVTSDRNFGLDKILNNKNSVSNPSSFGKAFVLHHFTELTTPLYIFLLNKNTAEFLKTAQYCHFLFSRPPPIFIS